MVLSEILQVLMSVIFGLSGIMKIFFSKKSLANRLSWVKTFKPSTIKMIGTVELLGSVLISLPLMLTIPWLTGAVAAGFIILMVGAFLTHTTRKQFKDATPSMILLAISSTVLYLNYNPLWSLLQAYSTMTIMVSYILLGTLGTFTAGYIYYEKHHKKKMVCNIVANDCNTVVNSKYGKMFGIDLTIPGILYYLGISLYGFLALILPSIFLQFSTVVLWASGAGAVFSLYLIFVQTFLIKQFCQYCLLSAAVSIAIFAMPLVL